MRRVLVSRRRSALLGLCLAFAAPLAAQREAPRDKETVRALELLRERNRETMHPGEQLTLVGLEQGDNEIRSRTPALVNCDPGVTLVDPADAYRRALAMYESGAIFHQPPARATSAAVHPKEKARPPVLTRAGAGPSESVKVSSALILAVGLLFLLGIRRHLRVFLRRRRMAA